ncbi:hypothetical protein [Chamaesiphon sp. GL140_3_metabinner_50]|uniref:hypothetical protein n=1 Tax=Chamaesiphon sp. GL140_3_metabinner_50 TaxID=2970812 RepID=UPI0025D618C4|nr:hypothetical protein [Chamaesiphon sp. GL140_3_metabinner_50]
MAGWEFLIQREGDRGWRQIETGNLQLMAGKYRIVASSNLPHTPIQTRITHQTSGEIVPKRRSRSISQTSNARGLVVIIPFTQLQSGIWQFVCSGMDDTQAAWHRILKLRVLPRTDSPSPAQVTTPHAEGVVTEGISPIDLDATEPPTEPLEPIETTLDERENWAEGLARLLEQLEIESLQPSHSPNSRLAPGDIQFNAICDPPSQSISLNRSTFAGIIPGNCLTIAGDCNLRLVNAELLQAARIEKLSICVRHPQTAEIVAAIERTLPPNLAAFTFRGQLDLPVDPQSGLLLGEVNLSDKYNIQLYSTNFTISLNLNPLPESELSLLQMFDRVEDDSAATVERLTRELKMEALTIGDSLAEPLLDARISSSARLQSPSTSTQVSPSGYPAVPLAYNRQSMFTYPEVVPVETFPTSHIFNPDTTSVPPLPAPSALSSAFTIPNITGDLEIDFADLTVDRSRDPHNYPNLEIVVDD